MTASDTRPLPPPNAAHLWACSCAPCRKRRSQYKKQWRLARHRGEPSPRVDSAPALNHIRRNLLPAAWTRMQVGYAAGLDPDYIPRMLGEQCEPAPRTLRAESAAAILALGPRDRFRNVPDGAHLDATGTRRRLQALAFKGHNIGELLHGLHCNKDLMTASLVTARNARLIVKVYDQLWKIEGPSPVGAVRARNRGWAGPGSWDDWSIDDPRAVAK